ncbi:helix-hairpin-helix domain-containing protein [Shewanella cyperi]|uniref:Helix-hairpin-helix domain-containing protein n=1 Tax=Shewanella cyperi TaxID=2814292 RepID=A0A974XL67_9GAMM|nr:helix-hairpin-helix domain-containing protein [Shewanella cyperi]QSX30442.1 helix-hairpin-helix domain-containing protein [Shewanella cyperi]QSX41216.1 helix-hairpin-helix domain-containing protein [Shewanella cyperi]
MKPSKVDRNKLQTLTDLPNVGEATAADLRLLGIDKPEQLCGKDPFTLYIELCDLTGVRHDPCVLDVFMSLTSFMDGGPALPWWDFTAERKAKMPRI